MFLETDRLILRKFQEEDFSDFCAYAMDAEMSRMMGRQMETEEDARVNFNWLKDQEERGYGLVLKKTGRVIGDLTVTPVPERFVGIECLIGKRGRSLTFSISRPYQRQGLMSEAVQAVIDRLFQEEGMDYVHCGYFSFNTSSRYFQEKLGFTWLADCQIEIQGTEIKTVENVMFRKTV